MAKPARELPQMHRPSPPVARLKRGVEIATPERTKQRRQDGAGVSARKLAVHLDLSIQRIAQLANIEHVIAKLPNGKFDQDACRVAYLRWLRDPDRRSARTKADADFVKAKTALKRFGCVRKSGSRSSLKKRKWLWTKPSALR